VLSISDGTEPKNRLYLRDARDPAAPWLRLFDRFDASYVLLGKVGQRLFFSTNLNAPRGRIVAVDLDQPGRLLPLVDEQPEALESATLVGGRLILSYLRHAASAVFLHDLDGQRICELPLPGIGAVVGFAGAEDDDETFFTWSGFLSPPRSFALTVATAAIRPWSKSAVDFDEGAYEVHQRFFRSADGTEVPLFVMHRKGLALDGRNPTQLYGYGGFSISLTPSFSVERAVWLEMGGVYAIANLRGGGEYGAAWHDAGRLRNKQNTFDDFIAAAEHLIAWGYTAPDKLAIAGGSNGGLLVGAVMLQRPELFGAVVCSVPLLDMKRYHRLLAGASWMAEYGDPDQPEQWAWISRYSPYQNVRSGMSLPPVLFTTSTRDDRVHPGHARKMAARMLEQGHDATYYENIEGGHGGAADNAQRADLQALEFAFLWQRLTPRARIPEKPKGEALR
jgi:prolyl oligopeptidase